jgi:hypothetical protein
MELLSYLIKAENEEISLKKKEETESLKKAQKGKMENFAGSVLNELVHG